MKNGKMMFLVVCVLVMLLQRSGYAQTVLYVPFDNRPVSLSYVTDTLEKGGFEILVPPEELLPNRTKSANPDQLWEWVFAHIKQADSVVVSSDAMIYGGLVASRTHNIKQEVLLERTKNFQKLKDMNPATRLYVFSTIMRSPHASTGGMEPSYYEQYGPAIFQINALRDKKELHGLTSKEQQELDYLLTVVPSDIDKDWIARREKNFNVNVELIHEVKKDIFTYLLVGRDDCWPYSRSHQESRWLVKETSDLPASQYSSFPSADQSGLIMLTRAMNDSQFIIPSVAVKYTGGVGEQTIPSYEDTYVGETVRKHLTAVGCVPLLSDKMADLILMVHTPIDGLTHEAGGGANPEVAKPETIAFVKQMQSFLLIDKKVAVADIAFANGSDNSLVSEMTKVNVVSKLESYSGWNTASNTIGYTIGQAIFARNMTNKDRQALLAVRLLDDCAYQANIRRALIKEELMPKKHSDVQLNEMVPELVSETEKRMNVFYQKNISWLPLKKIEVTFPWNRMFEVGVRVQQ